MAVLFDGDSEVSFVVFDVDGTTVEFGGGDGGGGGGTAVTFGADGGGLGGGGLGGGLGGGGQIQSHALGGASVPPPEREHEANQAVAP